MKPLKTIYNRRLAYLVSLDQFYQKEGYKTRLDGFNSILEVYPKEAKLSDLPVNIDEVRHAL